MVKALILRAPGINRDEDAAAAVELAGGQAERVHVSRLVERTVRLADYALLIIPGGFSYGDHLGAGKLLAVDLLHRLGDQLSAFVADGRPVIGICNGFQVLVKAGILPGMLDADQNQEPRIGSSPQALGSRLSVPRPRWPIMPPAGLSAVGYRSPPTQPAVAFLHRALSGRSRFRWRMARAALCRATQLRWQRSRLAAR